MNLKTKLGIAALTTAIFATAVSASAGTLFSAAPTYPVKVPFFQAAIFVMFGKEGDDVQYGGSPTKWTAPVVERAIVKDMLRVDPNTSNHRGNVFPPATWEVVTLKGEPCMLYASLLSPREAFNTLDMFTGEGNGGRRLDFDKMPSPRTITQDQSYPAYLNMELPNDAWCSSRQVVENGEIKYLRGSGTCNTNIMFKPDERWLRRIRALDYIRANYCKGQPEPAPQPRMPY
jgi:hypothetical protein